MISPGQKGNSDIASEGNESKAIPLILGIVAFAVVYVLYATLAKLLPLNSDSAYLILYAQDIIEGNSTLSGWTLTTVGFYSELPLYIVAIKLFGFEPELMRVVPAFIYALNVLLTATLIWSTRTVNSLSVFIPLLCLLILPTGAVWHYSLSGAIHQVTGSAILVCLLIAAQRANGQDKPWHSWSILVIAAVATWSDLAYSFMCLIPFALAAALASSNAEGKGNSPTSLWLPMAIGVLAGILFSKLQDWAGWGFPSGVATQFEQIDRLEPKAALLVNGWTEFFGANFWGLSLSVYSIAMVFVSVTLVWWGIQTFRVLTGREVTLDTIIALIPLCTSLAVVLSRRGESINDIRFLSPCFFTAVYLVTRFWQANISSWFKKSTMAVILIASFYLSAMSLNQNRLLLAGRSYDETLEKVVRTLEARNLTRGFADFWACHVLRVSSQNRLSLIPVYGSSERGFVAPSVWAAKDDWFIPMTGNFLVVGPHKGDPTIAVPPRDEIIIAAQKYWGKAERVDVDSFTILIWSTDVTIDSQEVPPTLARRLAR